MRVLLVDDEEKFVSRLAERLILRGFEADWAMNSTQAFSKVASAKYDVAVLDVKMPGMSGIDLKKKLQEMAPDMKYIFVTGHGSAEDYSAGSREGFCYIIKPFKIETLVEKINQAMNV